MVAIRLTGSVGRSSVCWSVGFQLSGEAMATQETDNLAFPDLDHLESKKVRVYCREG